MMSRKNYSFAGVEISIIMPSDIMYTDDRCLSHFATDAVTEPHVFTFELTDSMPAPRGDLIAKTPSFAVYRHNGTVSRYIGVVETGPENAYICAVYSGREHTVKVKTSRIADRVGTHTALTAIAAEHLLCQNNGVVFHCSFIDVGGKAVLFTAPSETGKSTQARLWAEKRNADIINGDRAAIRLLDGKLYAAGIPFSGSSHDCKNRTLPLAAVVYLRQAPTTSIRRMKGYEAFSKIWEGISVNSWDKSDMEKASEIVERLARSVPVYYMPCTPDESAVIALENALKGENQ